MGVHDILCKERVDVSDRQIADKKELFEIMAEMFYKTGNISSKEEFINALYEREELGSTYMEKNLVLPHGKSDCVKHAGVAICRFQPMQYDKPDEIAKIAVMLAIPKTTQNNDYLKLLASISMSLLDDDIMYMLMNEKDGEIVAKVMNEKISIN